jgi:hypothetical protein
MPLKHWRALLRQGLLRFDKFGRIDKLSDHSQGHACFMDYDSISAIGIPSLFSLARVCGFVPYAVCYSKTRRGWHVAALSMEKFKPIELVALQAIFGSDPMREAMDFYRARNIHKADAFWKTRWNIIYSEKVTK